MANNSHMIFISRSVWTTITSDITTIFACKKFSHILLKLINKATKLEINILNSFVLKNSQTSRNLCPSKYWDPLSYPKFPKRFRLPKLLRSARVQQFLPHSCANHLWFEFASTPHPPSTFKSPIVSQRTSQASAISSHRKGLVHREGSVQGSSGSLNRNHSLLRAGACSIEQACPYLARWFVIPPVFRSVAIDRLIAIHLPRSRGQGAP